MEEIKIIQGDTFEVKVKCTGVDDLSIIGKIYFSCKELGVVKEIEYDEENAGYILRFTPEETANFKPCTADFDITIKYTDGNTQTPVYRKIITVQRKVNICDGA